jgi:hypothetical protein
VYNIYSFSKNEIEEVGRILSQFGFYTYLNKIKEENVKDGWPPYMIVVSKEGPKGEGTN